MADTRTSLSLRLGALLAGAGLCALAALWSHGQASATPPPLPTLPAEPAATNRGSMDAGAPSEPPTTAQIIFLVVPPVEATVTWGKKRLGKIMPGQPLTVVRPRDSGPLDVIVRANGFLPVHTRAHTFSDTKVFVKLTPHDQQQTLLGYRVPIDAGLPIGADGMPVGGDAGVEAYPPPMLP